MQFVRDGGWLQVVRITGPAHNLLGIRFGASPTSGGPEVVALPSASGAAAIEAEDVAREVAAGVAEANAQFGADYVVAAIRYVPSDTPSPDVYRMLAKCLVERVVLDADFAP